MEDKEVPVLAGVQFHNFGNFRRNVQRSESDAVPKVAELVPKRNARDRRLPADDRMFTRHHLRYSGYRRVYLLWLTRGVK
jgi:hypothetical protein